MKPSPVTDGVHDATIRQRHAQGVSARAIAKELGVYRKTLSARLQALGLSPVKSSEPRACKDSPLVADVETRIEWRLDTDAFGALMPARPQGAVIRFRPRVMPARPDSGSARIGCAAGMCAEVRS